jgi:hypothetical protein
MFRHSRPIPEESHGPFGRATSSWSGVVFLIDRFRQSGRGLIIAKKEGDEGNNHAGAIRGRHPLNRCRLGEI